MAKSNIDRLNFTYDMTKNIDSRPTSNLKNLIPFANKNSLSSMASTKHTNKNFHSMLD